jgi:hypothetical protein
MNVVVELLGAILGRVAGWLVLGRFVWLLRMIGKGLGALRQPVLAMLGARRMDASGLPPGAAGPGSGATVTCPHCGAAVPPGAFCAVCGRALPGD